MKKILVVAAVAEAATGLAVMTVPSVVGKLLFGAELTGIAATVARLAGISLPSLGVGCWPDRNSLHPLFGLLTYNSIATLYFLWIGLNGPAGILLWPAFAIHAALTVLLVRAWLRKRQVPDTDR